MERLLSALESFDIGGRLMVGSFLAQPLKVPAQFVSDNVPQRRGDLRSRAGIRSHAALLQADYAADQEKSKFSGLRAPDPKPRTCTLFSIRDRVQNPDAPAEL